MSARKSIRTEKKFSISFYVRTRRVTGMLRPNVQLVLLVILMHGTVLDYLFVQHVAGSRLA